jgi:DNA polymerase-4
MKAVGIATVGDLYRLELPDLENHFGSYGTRLYQLARGIAHAVRNNGIVIANRSLPKIPSKSIYLSRKPSGRFDGLQRRVWRASRENARGAKTVVLKLKTKEFNSLTRSVPFRLAVVMRRTDFDCARFTRTSRARTKAALPFSWRRAQQFST